MGMKSTIDHGIAHDWGRVSRDYAKYRDIYPDIFFKRIVDAGLCVKGQTVLDLGTGTGVLPRRLSSYGARFVGVDISEKQIAQARRLTKEQGLEIQYIVCPAEKLCFPDGSFDVVTACMCFFYFDREAVLPKIHRVLKTQGCLCILYMSYMPDRLGISAASESLVRKYNPQWTGYGMNRLAPEASEWSKPLFDAVCETAYDVDIPFTRESWHGRMRACRGIGASSLSGQAIAAFEAEHLNFLLSMPASFVIPHYVTMLILRKKDL